MRKLVAMLVTLSFLALWIAGAATIGSSITGAPKWAQLLFYIVAGIGWAFPLKPLMIWMNSGQSQTEDQGCTKVKSGRNAQSE